MKEGGGEGQRDLCGSLVDSVWLWMPARVIVGAQATVGGCGQRCCLLPFFGGRGHRGERSDV